MNILVFDANVPWDLVDNIDKLDEIMQVMNNIQFKIYMSSINFNEMPVRVKRELRKHQHIIIEPEPEQIEYDEFRKEMQRNGIILDPKDSAVLYTSIKTDADYIISSDFPVRKMIKKYADIYSKKVKPFHLVNMLSFLREMNLVEPNSFIKMSLKLYKKKEIPYMVKRHGERLIKNNIEQNNWIKEETKTSVDTFNSYEGSILRYL